ncbi:MAG TPA: ATP synthase F0 subunit B [Bacteroidetes bacterium]|nr:ATP synthase F0 subunit B [Bacteroidota bacterium]
MELLTPALGLFFWTLLVFLIIVFMLKKLAWKPILSAIKDREDSIEEALQTAAKARSEMNQLQASIADAKKEAAAERERIMKEAGEMKLAILSQAKKDAQAEAGRIVDDAREAIQKEKAAAMSDIKSQVAALSLEIAEKVLVKKFENRTEQEALVQEYLKTISI